MAQHLQWNCSGFSWVFDNGIATYRLAHRWFCLMFVRMWQVIRVLGVAPMTVAERMTGKHSRIARKVQAQSQGEV